MITADGKPDDAVKLLEEPIPAQVSEQRPVQLQRGLRLRPGL